MKKETLRCVLSGLRKFRLTEAETEFIKFAKSCSNRSTPTDEMMEVILARIYMQKSAFIRDSVVSLLNQDKPITPSPHVTSRQDKAVGGRI